MGLDMYLQGEKSLWLNWENPEQARKEDGFKIDRIILDIGYWRKHPNLHGYIVNKFAGGVDECQRIDLTAANLRQIIEAVKSPENLPYTEGFFFGRSEGSETEVAEDVAILTRALQWLEADEPGTIKSIYYRASW